MFDDVNERIYPIRVRPRLTWHGGSAPTAMKKKRKEFDSRIIFIFKKMIYS